MVNVLIVFSAFIFITIGAITSYEQHSDNELFKKYSEPLNRDLIEEPSHWLTSAADSLSSKLNQKLLKSKAKNIILFLGDGMSISTITAARIYKGQLEGLKFGEEGKLHIDTFPYFGTSKTYCADAQIADSACTSTAYLCGVKGNFKTIGMAPSVLLNNCTAQMNKENHVESIFAWAQKVGKSTGLVTTATVTHASPSGVYAHIANREWENNARVEEDGVDSDHCDDIAEQLVYNEPGRNLNVILGGGRSHFLNVTVPDVEEKFVNGGRTDGKDLVQEWLKIKRNSYTKNKSKYVTSRDELMKLDTNKVDHLLGLFSSSHINYADEQLKNNDPSLADMTSVAVKILKKNPKGFILFVEGARIDMAHHDNLGRRALEETLQFDEAIQLVDNSTSDSDTLIVVSSDHSHLFTISGYSTRGNSILGFSNVQAATDLLPYTTLGYRSGSRGYRASERFNSTHCARANISDDPIFDYDYKQVAYVPMSNGLHSGEDVLIMAKGPWAHLFSGNNEQSFIPHGMAFAGCFHPKLNISSCDGHNY